MSRWDLSFSLSGSRPFIPRYCYMLCVMLHLRLFWSCYRHSNWECTFAEKFAVTKPGLTMHSEVPVLWISHKGRNQPSSMSNHIVRMYEETPRILLNNGRRLDPFKISWILLSRYPTCSRPMRFIIHSRSGEQYALQACIAYSLTLFSYRCIALSWSEVGNSDLFSIFVMILDHHFIRMR